MPACKLGDGEGDDTGLPSIHRHCLQVLTTTPAGPVLLSTVQSALWNTWGLQVLG
jgi:hypothetical protein